MVQVRDHAVYRAGDVLLLRAAARPLDSAFGSWPDPADGERLRVWLVKAWQDPVLREAVACASPSLALRADRIAADRRVPARQVRSAAVALARYQLRAAGRPTPFGLFAGVAGATFGDSAFARFGEEHLAVARCDAAWLLSVIERCEACEPLVDRDDRHVVVPQDRPRSDPRTGDRHRMHEHRLLLEQRHGQARR